MLPLNAYVSNSLLLAFQVISSMRFSTIAKCCHVLQSQFVHYTYRLNEDYEPNRFNGHLRVPRLLKRSLFDDINCKSTLDAPIFIHCSRIRIDAW